MTAALDHWENIELSLWGAVRRIITLTADNGTALAELLTDYSAMTRRILMYEAAKGSTEAKAALDAIGPAKKLLERWCSLGGIEGSGIVQDTGQVVTLRESWSRRRPEYERSALTGPGLVVDVRLRREDIDRLCAGSLHAAAASQQPDVPVTEAPAGTFPEQARCKRWLVDLMTRGRDKPISKGKVREMYRTHGAVSERGFIAAWSQAVTEAGSPKWAQPGRRPKI